MINIYPVKIEAIDEGDKSIQFTVDLVDGCSAKVDIKTLVSVDNWQEISDAILKSLEMMK